MGCASVTIGAGVGDKYYDCVKGKCDEKIGGAYKNDPKCASKCAPADNTRTYILLGAAVLGALYFMAGRK